MSVCVCCVCQWTWSLQVIILCLCQDWSELPSIIMWHLTIPNRSTKQAKVQSSKFTIIVLTEICIRWECGQTRGGRVWKENFGMQQGVCNVFDHVVWPCYTHQKKWIRLVLKWERCKSKNDLTKEKSICTRGKSFTHTHAHIKICLNKSN